MQIRKSSFALSIVRVATVALILSVAGVAFASGSTTYTETTLYAFGANVVDGVHPTCNGLVFDKSGNLYGTTENGGAFNAGTVFELSPNESGGWNETVIHAFDPSSTSGPDGANPCGSLVLDSKGNLYGTTVLGGANNTGTVWELTPPTVTENPWTETVLYSFGAEGSGDGYNPLAGVTLKTTAATVLYGTTPCGGSGPAPIDSCQHGSGTVYELTFHKKTTKVASYWTESIIHSFSGPDGFKLRGGLLLNGGNLYGYAPGGTNAYTDCYQCGVVFELQPGADGWTENVLYNFGATITGAWFGDYGGYGAPVMDAKKNLYGTTDGGGTYGNGTVWELVYSTSTETYTAQVLYSIGANADWTSPDWQIVNSKGSWFCATGGSPSSVGNVLKLTYSAKTGWQETDIYDQFSTGSLSSPGYNQLIATTNGNLYGMVVQGGEFGSGAVFELSPSAP